MKTLRFMPRGYEEMQAILAKAGYQDLAQAIDASLQRARLYTPIGIAARLMYEGGTQPSE